MVFDFNFPVFRDPHYKVVGIGKYGVTAVNHLLATKTFAKAEGVSFLTISASEADSSQSQAPTRIVLEETSDEWVKAPVKMLVKSERCESDRLAISECIGNADVVVIIAGMGCPVTNAAVLFTAEIARELDLFSVGLVSSPFSIEGLSMVKNAAAGIDALIKLMNSTIVIQNDRLIDQSEMAAESLSDARSRADEALGSALMTILGFVFKGYIGTDLADVKVILGGCGWQGIVSIGRGEGENGAEKAAQMAFARPLANDVDWKSYRKLLIMIATSPDAGLIPAAQKIIDCIDKHVDSDSQYILQHMNYESGDNSYKVTIVAVK